MSAQSRRNVAAEKHGVDSLIRGNDTSSTSTLSGGFDFVGPDMTLTSELLPIESSNSDDNKTTFSCVGFSLSLGPNGSGKISLFFDLAPPIPSDASGHWDSGRNDVASIRSSSESLGSLPSSSKRNFGDVDSGYSDTSDAGDLSVGSQPKRRKMKRNRPSANLSEGAGSLGERHSERHLDPLLAKHQTEGGFVSEDPDVVDRYEQESNARDPIMPGGEKPINNPAPLTQLAIRPK